MIKVCDAIMGAGKTSACINMMNEYPDNKYIFITPYLEEATRIREACPALNFVEPSNKLSQYGFTKAGHTIALIEEGRNIASTHQAFSYYTQETLDLIKEKGYTLIIDENMEVLEKFDIAIDDLQIAIDAGYITENNGIFTLVKTDYKGKALSELFRLLKSRDLVRVDIGESEEVFFWTLPTNLLTSFKDVYILTYLFSGQGLHHFMQLYNLNYEYIGIKREGSEYSFCEYPGYTPEYTKTLHEKLHIVDSDKLNSIGDNYYSLSMTWFDNNVDEVVKLKNNIYNVFNHILDFIPAEQRMWGSHKAEMNKLKGKGYTNGFVIFNTRATNKLKNKTCLVYATNVFMNVREKLFYKLHGIEVDEDEYALSTMIQWIWRSAIRDGEDIYLYIPSKRMRELLLNWIDLVSKGGVEVEYQDVS